MYKTNSLWATEDSVYRILSNNEEVILAFNCIRQSNPIHVCKAFFEGATEISEEQLRKRANIAIRNDLSVQEQTECDRKYIIISSLINVIGDPNQRCRLLREIAKNNGMSTRGVKKWLYKYIAFQDKRIFAPPPKRSLERTQIQKNFRWALGKFFYTKYGKSLTQTYISMIRERYCDANGNLLDSRPSIHQFRYYFKKHNKKQTELISRQGLSNYQRNYRPLLGDGVQAFAPCIGTGMIDSTLCDIYLADAQGNVIGRPILTVCIDAYSKLCCGYYLGWEGGMYSVRNLLLNIIANKVSFCQSYGIEISKEEWPCDALPSILVTDRGAEFSCFNFEQVAELGVKIVILPAFRPELKGPVEQFFNLLQNAYKPYLCGKGVIQKDFGQRGGKDYRKEACITLMDFERIIIHCIIFFNSKRVLDKFPYSEDMLKNKVSPFPSSIWTYQFNNKQGKLIQTTSEQLIATTLPRATGRFTRTGLIVNRLRYSCKGFTEEFLKGGTTIVAYNPDDVTHVFLVERDFKRFDLIETRFAGAKLSKVKESLTTQKEITKEHAEEALQGKIDLISHIQTIVKQGAVKPKESINLIRESKRIEKYARHIDILKGGRK